MKEFPKALFKGGDGNQDFVIVDSAEDESDARADGYEPVKAPEEKGVMSARRGARKGYSTGVVSEITTELAAEAPGKGYIYATSGSAPTPGHFNQEAAGDVLTKPVDPMPHATGQEGAEKSKKKGD